jgi:hypothetical protein
MRSLEEFLLIHLDSHKGLNLGTDKLVRELISAHSGQLVHHGVNLNILLLEHLSSLSAALKALSDLLCEDLLDTEQGNLRLVLVYKVDKSHLEGLNGSVLADGAHGSLHRDLKLAEPVFDVTLALNGVIKINCLGSSTEFLADSPDESAVDTVECHTTNGIEHHLEIVLNCIGISTNGQDLEQVRVGDEVETREDASLLLKIGLEFTLAVFKVLLHLWESTGEQIVLAAADDEFCLGGALHNLPPLSVNVLEDLRFLGHLLCNLTTSKDEHERHPLIHNLEPFFKGLLN